MTKLSVNLNAVAQLRNRRTVPWPSVVGIGRLVLQAGADGLTVHPRPDERHIRRTDVFDLAALLRGEFPAAEYNIEGYPSPEFLALVEEARPDQVTFVPDDPSQATSDHGWDVAANRGAAGGGDRRMRELGIRVSLFVDPDPLAPADAWEVGADRIELYTGPYGGALEPRRQGRELEKLRATADAARAVGGNGARGASRLEVNAGHDLDARQPAGAGGGDPRPCGGLDRACDHRRCAADGLSRGGAALPGGAGRGARCVRCG